MSFFMWSCRAHTPLVYWATWGIQKPGVSATARYPNLRRSYSSQKSIPTRSPISSSSFLCQHRPIRIQNSFHQTQMTTRNFSALPWIYNNNNINNNNNNNNHLSSTTVVHQMEETTSSTQMIPPGMMVLPSRRPFPQQVRAKHSFKTHKGVAKRIRVRGKGKLVRNKVGHQHNTGHLKRASKNKRGCSTTSIGDKNMDKKYRMALGVFGKK